VLLCEVPQGQTGRPSKSLTLVQAEALVSSAASSPLHAYIVVSLLTGARTEELRPLTWSHVDLDGDPANDIPPNMMVWRSVRAGGDTKTRKSRQTIALPARCVAVLRQHLVQVATLNVAAGGTWQEHDLVFPSRSGTVSQSAKAQMKRPATMRPGGLVGPSYSVSYATAEGDGFVDEAAACWLVGDTGIEPVTSSV
jgi:integrase